MKVITLQNPEDTFTLENDDDETVIVDISKLDLISSMTLGSILKQKDRIIIAGPKPASMNIIKLFNIDKIVPIASTIENARRMIFINREMTVKVKKLIEDNKVLMQKNQDIRDNIILNLHKRDLK
jgi:hypothetical protein